MWVESIAIENVRCFINDFLEFSKGLNVIVGKNNSGKSTIIKSLALPQYANLLNDRDITTGSKNSKITTKFANANIFFPNVSSPDNKTMYVSLLKQNGNFSHGGSNIPSTEPNNFIFPYFAHRKVSSYSEDIRESEANDVSTNLKNIAAKISVVSASFHPKNKIYQKTCEDLLGFLIGNIPSANGQWPGTYTPKGNKIPMQAMGDGVANLVGFIYGLITAENKLFLIEEPENDLHPTALKLLLELIVESSKKNQFIISTHSNIVVKRLGAQLETKVFKIQILPADNNYFQTSKSQLIQNTDERRAALEELGYEYYDEDEFNAWIFFEESSAEKIVRDFLIPNFTPEINGKIRTFSAKSVTKVQKRFEEFNNLFCFLNLTQKYKNRAWVIVDSGSDETATLNNLKNTYVNNHNWSEDNFLQLSLHDFEEYYPKKFQNEVEQIKNEKDQNKKRNLKSDLLNAVLNWIYSSKNEAITEFEQSAKEIIDILKNIESKVMPLK